MQSSQLEMVLKEIGTQAQIPDADRVPSLQILADKQAQYASIAQVMSFAQENGITRIGFVLDRQATSEH